MLARPFQYEHHFFIRHYTKLIISAAVNALITVPLLFLGLYFAYGDLPCYDTSYGMLFCDPDHLHICLIPLFLVHFLIIIFAVLFSIEYAKMRKIRHSQYESNYSDNEKAAADYVLISTAAYFVGSFFLVLNNCITLGNMEAPLFKSITLFIDQMNGIWNILALYVVMDAYRKKVKQMICIGWDRCKNVSTVTRVQPALENTA
jgi:hypothetical protein